VSDLGLVNGTLDTGANTLTVNGDISVTSGTFAAASSIIFADTGSGTIPGSAYQNLDISRNISLGGDVTVSGTLTLSANLTLGNYTLTLGDSATVSGSGMVITDGAGELRKTFTATGSFEFPVSSGLTLNFTDGTFASAYAGVKMTSGKHPGNSSAADYLDQYWSVTESGISDFICEVTAIYSDGDVSGTEANIWGGYYDGSGWTLLSRPDIGTNEIFATVSRFGDFTGGEHDAFAMASTGNALTFDGTSNYVDLGMVDAGNPLALAGSPFTIEAWINPVLTGDQWQRIVDKATLGDGKDGYAFSVRPDGKLHILINDRAADYLSADPVTPNRWSHVAVTGNGTSYTFYISGREISGTLTGSYQSPPSATAPMHLGAWYDGADRSFSGQMDEVRIWNVARSEAQIQTNMLRTLDPASETNLLACYRFDHVSGSKTLTDLTLNHNDGILKNMAGTEWTASGAIMGDVPAGYQNDVNAVWDASPAFSTAEGLSVTLSSGSGTDAAILGRDSGTGENTSDIPPGEDAERLGRTWYADITGAVTTDLIFDISYADSVLDSTPPSLYRYILLERNGDSGDFTVAGTADSKTGDRLTFSSISLQHGYTYSLALRANTAPTIAAQASAVSVPEENGLNIPLTALSVTDPDNTFPADYALTVSDGAAPETPSLR